MIKKINKIELVLIVLAILFLLFKISANEEKVNFGDNKNFEEEKIKTENNEKIEERGFGENQYKDIYIEIEKVIEEKELEEKNKIEEKNFMIYKDGNKELEYNIKQDDIEIKKEELIINEFEKKVRVYSEKHLEEKIKVYSFLTKEVEKDKIRIYWENKNQEITNLDEFQVEYFDENKNGLIEKISWIIPHLSEQIFRIVIENELNVDINQTDEILLDCNSPANGSLLNNPILFNFKTNYSYIGNLNCNLSIDDDIKEIFPLNFSYNWNKNLINGRHTWKLFCLDKDNPNKNSTLEGFFFINKDFNISELEKKVYYIKEKDILFNLTNNNSVIKIELIKPNNSITIINNSINSSGNFQLNIPKENLDRVGLYKINITDTSLENQPYLIKEFSVVNISFEINKTSANINEEIEFNIKINSSVEKILFTMLSFDDSNISLISNTPQNLVINQTKHRYVNVGNYSPKLDINIGGIYFESRKNISVIQSSGSSANSEIDQSPPRIEITYPKHKEIVYGERINFEYKVSDNIKLKNCSIKIYNATMSGSSSWDIQGLVFPLNDQDKIIAEKTELGKNETIKILIEGFKERGYSWYVECYDNSSNKAWDSNYFYVNLSNSTNLISLNDSIERDYPKRIILEDALEKINDFLTRRNTFSIEEEELVEQLNLIKDMETYKRRLIQIDQDLKRNVYFISEESKREQRIYELNKEIDDIRKNIVKDIKVIESQEYVKNSINIDFSLLVKEYFKIEGIEIENKKLKELIKTNSEIQKDITVKSKIWKASIEKIESKEEFTFVLKEIRINSKNNLNNLFILEILPEKLIKQGENINFSNKDIKKIGERIFRIKESETKIFYYLNGFKEIEEIKESDTILFSEAPIEPKDLGIITGFSVVEVVDSENPVFYFILLLLILLFVYLGYTVFNKIKSNNLKKDPNIYKIIDLIEDSRKALLENEIERARANYYKIKTIYPVLPEKGKMYVFDKIKKLELGIDKRDIFNLVKEYEEAKRNFRIEDSKEIYEKIKTIYKRINPKDQEEIYKRVLRDFI